MRGAFWTRPKCWAPNHLFRLAMLQRAQAICTAPGMCCHMPHDPKGNRAGALCQAPMAGHHWTNCGVGFAAKGVHDKICDALFDLGRKYRLAPERERSTPWLKNPTSKK